jgi:hypothetical protein
MASVDGERMRGSIEAQEALRVRLNDPRLAIHASLGQSLLRTEDEPDTLMASSGLRLAGAMLLSSHMPENKRSCYPFFSRPSPFARREAASISLASGE